MKRTTYYLLPVLLLGLVTVVNAQTTTEDRAATTSERQEERQERVEERQVVAEERRAALTERKQERITNLAANMSNRFDRVIARLQNIIDRIDSRIGKQADAGKDTSEAAAALARAQTSLNQAKGAVSNIDEQVNDVVGSSEPRTEWKNLKATYLIAKELIKTTHSELRTAISILKNGPTQPEEPDSEEETGDESEDEEISEDVN